MGRVLAGIACVLLLISGTVLMWRGSAQPVTAPPAPNPRLAAAVYSRRAGHARADRRSTLRRSQEQGRKAFRSRRKNDDGRITLAEMVEPRRKTYAKLDLNQVGRLSFEEWAVKTIDKFEDANAGGDGALSPAEYAVTAPKPRAKKTACACV